MIFNNFDFLHLGVNSLAFIVMVLVLVLVHELGHYLLAILFNVKVEAFSLGFGPQLFSFRDKRQTVWKVCAIPLGGYVKMQGEMIASDKDNRSISDLSPERAFEIPDPGDFQEKAPWKKSLIVLAGPAFNIIFAFLVVFALFWNQGIPKATSPVISEVKVNSPAEFAGLLPGDKIVSINGGKVDEVSKMIEMLKNGPHVAVIELIRDSTDMSITVNLDEERKIGVGLEASYEFAKGSLLELLRFSVLEVYARAERSLFSIKELIFGEEKLKNVGGMIRIAQYSGSAARTGSVAFCNLMAFISINLAVINLLPIPGLDGGHLVFYLLDCILVGRLISNRVRQVAMVAGFCVLVGLMIISNANDVIAIFNS